MYRSDECVIATICNGKYEVIGVTVRPDRISRPPSPNPYSSQNDGISLDSIYEGETEDVELPTFPNQFSEREFEEIELPDISRQPATQLGDEDLAEIVVQSDGQMPKNDPLPAPDGKVNLTAELALAEPLPEDTRVVDAFRWGSGSDTLCTRVCGYALSVIFWIFMVVMGFFITSDMFEHEDGQDHDEGNMNTTNRDIFSGTTGFNVIVAGQLEDMTD